MTMTKVFTKGFLSMAAIGLYAASSVFADTHLMKGQGTDGTVMEVSGDQRMVKVDASESSVCVVGSMVLGDQRRPDQHMTDSNGSRILTSTETEECSAHGYMMPMNR